MKVDAAILRRLAALNMPSECFAGVLSILADLQGADDARRKKDRERKSKPKSTDNPRKDTRNSTETDPSYSLKEVNKIPEANASGDAGPTQADLERELFRRGRQVCGKASGGLIASLLKSKQHDVSLARSVLELAATKHDPREYVAAALKGKSNGHGSEIAGAFAELRLELDGAGDGGQGGHPMRDITPGRAGAG